MPAADMQWRARKIAMHAGKLADQARPMTKKATIGAAGWARPRVGRVRAWMAVRAARGSVSVQETVAPKVSSVLAGVARRLDPPRPQSRRWPKVLAGTALLAAGAAAATAMAMRSRSRKKPPPMSRRPPSNVSNVAPDQRSKVLNPSAEAERAMAETNGISRTR
ncbi:MAG TPA: hypothetical protein VEV63_05960 [Streptosporangiaceae bacterium]|jgi:hypothetical protein|nr:hypothetical protein [Streptosporangiaceae bacterium]